MADTQTHSSAADLLNRGMICLTEHMGVIKAERFVALLSREKFDYTKWQRDHFDQMPAERISREAEEHERTFSYTGTAVRL